jgi:hypothetical protein
MGIEHARTLYLVFCILQTYQGMGRLYLVDAVCSHIFSRCCPL